MAKKKLIKMGDRTLSVSQYGELNEFRNRIPNTEAAFAMDLIMADQSGNASGAIVERAFKVARLTFAHIKANRMDTPFPFAKVFPDDSDNE